MRTYSLQPYCKHNRTLPGWLRLFAPSIHQNEGECFKKAGDRMATGSERL